MATIKEIAKGYSDWEKQRKETGQLPRKYQSAPELYGAMKVRRGIASGEIDLNEVVTGLNSRIDSWGKGVQQLSDDYNARFGESYDRSVYRSDSSSWLDDVTGRRNQSDTEAEEIKSLMRVYGEYLNDDYVKSVSDYFDGNKDFFDGVIEHATIDNDYWSQWGSEEEFNTYWDEYARYKEYEKGISNWDYNTEKAKVDQLERDTQKYNDAKANINLTIAALDKAIEAGDINFSYTDHLGRDHEILGKDYDFLAADSSGIPREIDLQAGLKNERAYLQTLLDTNSMFNDDRFISAGGVTNLGVKQISGSSVAHTMDKGVTPDKSVTPDNGVDFDAERAELKAMEYTYEGFKFNAVANPWSEFYDPEFEEYAKKGCSGITKDDIKGVDGDNVTNEEFKIYGYYKAKDKENGTDLADKYIYYIKQGVNERKGQEIADRLKGNFLGQMAYGAWSGIEQFGSGIAGWFADEYTPTSATQYASSEIREDIGEDNIFKWYNFKTGEWNDVTVLGNTTGQILYDIGNTTANMLPSILTSTAVGAVATPTVGAAVGTLLLGASAGGTAKVEMLNMGYSEGQATAYGLMVGSSEAGLSYLLSGIPGLRGSDGAFSALGNKVISKVDNAMAKAAIALGGNMLDEGLEEGLQTVLENWFKEIATGVDFENPSVDEILYSSLLGSLTAAGFGGGKLAVNGVLNVSNQISAQKSAGKSFNNNLAKNSSSIGDVTSKVLDSKTGLAENTKAYKQAQKIQSRVDKGKRVSNLSVGALALNLSESQQLSAVQSRLSSHIENKSDRSNMAQTIVDVMQGRDVSDKALYKVIGNKYAFNAMNDILGAKLKKGATINDVRAAIKSYQSVSSKASEGKQSGSAAKKSGQNGAMFTVSENADGGYDVIAEAGGESATIMHYDTRSQAQAAAYAQTLQMGSNGTEGLVFVSKSLSEGADIGEVAQAFNAIYNQGKSGKAMSAVRNLELLSPEQRQYAYQLGVMDRALNSSGKKTSGEVSADQDQKTVKNETDKKATPEFLDEKKTDEAQEKVDSSKNPNGEKKKGAVIYDGDRSKLSDMQKKSLDVLDKVAEALGVTFRIYESERVNGKFVYKKPDEKKTSANGWYETKTGEIWLDINAGLNGEGTLIFTAAHELTHFIKQWSPKKFKIFADFLIEQYGERGISIDELVQRRIDKAKKNGEDIDPDVAYEEVIADSCETFLRDSNAAEKIVELNQKDASLAQKIKRFLGDMLKRLRELMQDFKPQSREGRIVSEMTGSLEQLHKLWTDALADAGEAYSGADDINVESDFDVKYAERDYPIDADVENTVNDAFIKSNSSMHELSDITEGQNSAINKLVNQTNDQSYRGKYTGGKHLFSDYAVKHIIREHGDFLREGLRAQLPMTIKDIARHLSAVKANKVPASTKASKTKEGRPSILTSYQINGYTLYAEEIKKSPGKNLPSDLIGHTMYKAPTLPTAAFNATSARTQPKRQSVVLCNYYTSNSTNLSTGNFIQNSNGLPGQLNYISVNGGAKQDSRSGGLIALSSNASNFTDTAGTIEQGYVRCNKPFYITADNRVFSNSDTNVVEKINELKKQGYDCFIFEKTPGDNYMVAVVNKAQIIKNKPTIVSNSNLTNGASSNNNNNPHSDRDYDAPTNREILANLLAAEDMSPSEKGFLTKYKNKIAQIEANEAEISSMESELAELKKVGKKNSSRAIELEGKIENRRKEIARDERLILNLEATKPIRDLLNRERDLAYAEGMLAGQMAQGKDDAAKLRRAEEKLANQKRKDGEALAEYKKRVAEREAKIKAQHAAAKQRASDRRHSSEIREKIKEFKDKLQKTLKHPTDRKYIPGALAQAMIDVCELIDTDTELYKDDGTINKAQERREKTRETLARLRAEYNNIAKDADPLYKGEYDEAIAEYFDALESEFRGKSLGDMSREELERMYEILHSIDETLKNARKIIGWKEANDAYEAGNVIISEQKKIAGNRKDGKRNVAKKIYDGAGNQSLSPVRRVLEICAYDKNSPLYKLFKGFEKGVREAHFFEMGAKKSFEVLTKNSEVYENAVYTADGGNKYTDVNGRRFGISKMQKMQAVLSFEREAANKKTHHIEKGGLVFADIRELTKGNLKNAVDAEYSHKVTGPEAVRLIEQFKKDLEGDSWAQDYMAAARVFFNETAKNAINDVYMKLKHRILATDLAYIPFEVDQNSIVREISAEYDIQKTISSYGMLKEMQGGASNALIMTGLNNVLERHIDQVSTIHGLAIPIRDFNKVWNVKSVDGTTNVKEQIQATAGFGATKLIKQTVQDLQGERIKHLPRFYKKLKSNYIGATFFLNMSVVFKQIGSMFSAVSVIGYRDPVRMMGNLIYTFANSKKITAEVDKYTATAWMRRQGLSDAELQTLKTERRKTKLGKFFDGFGSHAMIQMDYHVALSLWKYAKQDVAKKTGLRGDQLLKATAEYYDELIENTQSMTDVLHRPEIQRGDGITTELFGTFKTDLYQNAGNLRIAMGQFAHNRTKENAAQVMKTVSAIMTSALWGSIVTSIVAALRYKVKRYRDEEDDELTVESWLEVQLQDLAQELVGYAIPLGGSEAFDAIANMSEGNFGQAAFSVIPFDAVNDLYSDISTLFPKIVSGEDLSKKDYFNIIRDCGNILGIPTANILRTIEATRLHIEDFKNGEPFSFEAELQDPNAYRLYKAMLEGDKDKIEKASRKFKNDDAITKAIRDQLRERDPRIREAAMAYIAGDMDRWDELYNEILEEGIFDEEDIGEAIKSESNSYATKVKEAAQAKADGQDEDYESILDALFERYETVFDEDDILDDIDEALDQIEESEGEPEKEYSRYSASHANAFFDQGDDERAMEILDDLFAKKVDEYLESARREAEKSGKRFNERTARKEAEKKAESSLQSSVTSYWKPLYIEAYSNGDDDEMRRIKEILKSTGFYENVNQTTDKWIK